MRETDDLWKEYIENDSWSLISTIKTNGTEYDEISAPVISRNAMSSALSIGECLIASLEFSIMTDDTLDSDYPITVLGKLTEGEKTFGGVVGTDVVGEFQIAYDEMEYSNQLEFGTFYIDQRSVDYLTGLQTFICYDRMMMMEKEYPTDDYTEFPKNAYDAVCEIADEIGTELDERTETLFEQSETWMDLVVPYDADGAENTMMTTMGYIAGCCGGNWIITEEDKLRLITIPTALFGGVVGSAIVGEAVIAYSNADIAEVDAITGGYTTGTPVTIDAVTVNPDDEDNELTYGETEDSNTSVEIEITNPIISDDAFDELCGLLIGQEYNGYEISSAVYDPAIEIGDIIRIVDSSGIIATYRIFTTNLTFNTAFRADITAPINDEYSSIYPYETAKPKDGKDGKDGEDGEDGQMLYATCETSASTKAKVATLDSGEITLTSGVTVCVTFTYANTVANATLNVESTGAKTIYANGSALTSVCDYNWGAGSTVQFVYSGSHWVMVDGSTSALASELSDDVEELEDELTALDEYVANLETEKQNFVYVNDTYANGGGAYVTLDEDASTTNAPSSDYLRLSTEGLEIAYGGDTVSSFGDDEIHLGVNSEEAVIYFCGDAGMIGEITTDQIGVFAPNGEGLIPPPTYTNAGIKTLGDYYVLLNHTPDDYTDDGEIASYGDITCMINADAFYYNGYKRFNPSTGSNTIKTAGYIWNSKKSVSFIFPYNSWGRTPEIDDVTDVYIYQDGSTLKDGVNPSFEAKWKFKSYFQITLTFSSAISGATNVDTCAVYATVELSF